MTVRWFVILGLLAAPALADTQAVYLLHCGGCHLADGRGVPPEVPSLRGDLGHIVQVPGGREYVVQVPGASQAPVSDEVLTQIINWILVEFNASTLAEEFEPLSTPEVSRSRKRVLADPLKTRKEVWRGYE